MQGSGSIFQNASLKNLHPFPLAWRNSAGARLSPSRPDSKRGTVRVSLLYQLYLPNRPDHPFKRFLLLYFLIRTLGASPSCYRNSPQPSPAHLKTRKKRSPKAS
jgi:hypothetical protein